VFALRALSLQAEAVEVAEEAGVDISESETRQPK
jgi:hypothetical protein